MDRAAALRFQGRLGPPRGLCQGSCEGYVRGRRGRPVRAQRSKELRPLKELAIARYTLPRCDFDRPLNPFQSTEVPQKMDGFVVEFTITLASLGSYASVTNG